MPPLSQRRLFASPQKRFAPEFSDDSAFHSPSSPAQASGGRVNELRITAVSSPFLAGAKCSSPSAPAHRRSSFPSAGWIAATPSPPSTHAVNRISPSGCQKSWWADQFVPGVRFLAAPPSTGTVQTSPPVEPSSLMMPWMTATERLSGEKRGQAICSSGFQIARVCPVAASTR